MTEYHLQQLELNKAFIPKHSYKNFHKMSQQMTLQQQREIIAMVLACQF